MSEQTEAFVRRLAGAWPGLRELLDEHLRVNFGEVLPHVFFGDITRWATALQVQSRRDIDLAAGSGEGVTPRVAIPYTSPSVSFPNRRRAATVAPLS